MKKFEMINGPNVPKSIQPMTELHDILVNGYEENKDIQVPKLIKSIENRISNQIEELVKLENQIQSTNYKLVHCMEVIRKVLENPDTSLDMSDYIMNSLNTIYEKNI